MECQGTQRTLRLVIIPYDEIINYQRFTTDETFIVLYFLQNLEAWLYKY